MKKKFLNCISVAFLAVTMALPYPMTAHAATLAPDDYVISLILSACGVYPGVYTGWWLDVFEGFLESEADDYHLAMLHELSDLSWGDTVESVDELVFVAKRWLSQSPDYVSGGSKMFELSSSSYGQNLKPTTTTARYISTTPFDECAEIPDSGYSYLFSVNFLGSYNDSPVYVYQNYYVPDSAVPSGKEVVAFFKKQSDYYESAVLRFGTTDDSSGWVALSSGLKSMNCAYYVSDGSLAYQNTSSVYAGAAHSNCVIRQFLDHPFKCFASSEYAEQYGLDGTVSRLVHENTFHLPAGQNSDNVDFHNAVIYSCSSTLTLPADVSTAQTLLSPFDSDMSTLDTLQSSLSAAGLEVSYTAPAVDIITQPVNQWCELGDTLTFEVVADNAVSYQWQYNADDGDTWINVSDCNGYDTSILQVKYMSWREILLYRCALSDAAGNVTYTDVVKIDNSLAPEDEETTAPTEEETTAPVIDTTDPADPAESMLIAFSDILESLKTTLLHVIPKALLIVSVAFVIIFGLKIWRKLTGKI